VECPSGEPARIIPADLEALRSSSCTVAMGAIERKPLPADLV
jgi:hypothetical protein